MSWVCSKCRLLKGSEAFSKSQLQKVKINERTSIVCIACNPIVIPIPKTTKNEVKSSSSSKLISLVTDPSLQYIDRPGVTPMTRLFQSYFASFHGTIPIPDILVSKKLEGWRSTSKLCVRHQPTTKNSANKQTCIGLFQPGTHHVLDATHHPAHSPSINLAAQIIQQCMVSLGVLGYIEGLGDDDDQIQTERAYIKYLVLSSQQGTGALQVTLVCHASRDDCIANHLISQLAEMIITSLSTALHSLWINYHPSSRYCNTITGRDPLDWIRIYGDELMIETLTLPSLKHPHYVPLYFSPFVFRQANIDIFALIIEEIRRFIDADSGWHGLELYGGVGTIGLHLIDRLARLVCSDENPNNERCFNESLKALKRKYREKATYITGRAADLATTGIIHQGFDFVIVDPPRKGLEEEVLHQLLLPLPDGDDESKSRPNKKIRFDNNETDTNVVNIERMKLKRLIYVSCGFEAFQRDCDQLTNRNNDKNSNRKRSLDNDEMKNEGAKWKLVFAKGFVMFPGADHIETLAIFDRL